MSSPKSKPLNRRRSSAGCALKESTTEDQVLNTIAKEAEARLAAKRAARAEARSIRMREIERRQNEAANQQQLGESDAESESEIRASRSKSESEYQTSRSKSVTGASAGTGKDFHRNYSLSATAATMNGTTRDSSSGRSTPDHSNTSTISNGHYESQHANHSLGPPLNHASMERELARLRECVKEGEDKYKRAMMNAAQLDNEKQAFQYQVELLKDIIEEIAEQVENVNGELLAKTRDYNKMNREYIATRAELDKCMLILAERERVMNESGLNFDGTYNEEVHQHHCRFCRRRSSNLDELGEGTGGEWEKSGNEIRERGSLLAEITSLRSEITDLREESRVEETRKEADHTKRTMQNQMNELKTQIQALEQQNAQKDGLLIRLETQVKRYKQQADNAESVEDSLLAEKRKISRELRQCQEQIVDLENERDHLKKRLEKLKSRRGFDV